MPESNKPTVVARNVSKTFTVTKDGSEIAMPGRRDTITVEAVKPVSFVAYSGESIGILGRNGSGKSTLLSMIAGNEKPTTGDILVSSQPSLLSVSAALQPHLSGIENVRLGLLAKGLPAKEVEEMLEPVAEWADIGEAVHRPIKTYSSGMSARLKFSIATAVRPEILLVDEALATGDSTFNSRAQERMDAFLEGASTVFIVSHSAGTIARHCTRALWIHDGEVLLDLPAPEAVKWYNMWSKAEAEGDRFKAAKLIRRMRNDYVPPNIILDSEAVACLNAASDDAFND